MADLRPFASQLSVFHDSLALSGHRRGGSARGFTLLELVVVISIIALLFTAAAWRLWGLQVDAERAAMETVLGTLRSALGMKVAERYIKGDVAGMRALEGSNPMRLLAQSPANYLGELSQVEPARIARGHWYFDRDARLLVYQVKNTAYFQGGGRQTGQARFAVRAVPGSRDAAAGGFSGIDLVAVESYTWIDWGARPGSVGAQD